MAKNIGPALPTGPFVAWLEEQLEALRKDETLTTPRSAGAATEAPVVRILAERLGVTDRTLYRYLRSLDGMSKPTETFGTYPVEDMLEHAGARLADVYPETDVDVDVEPDAWCWACEETITPIDATCPWCENTDLAEPKPKRGGWKRPDRSATHKLSDEQLQALHKVYERDRVSVNDLAKQIWENAGYANYESCARGIYKGWARLDLPCRDRIEATRLKCTIHGMAPKHAPRRREYRAYLRAKNGQVQPRCKSTVRGYPRHGEQCERPAMQGSEYCTSHDPARELARQAHLAKVRRLQTQRDMLPMAPFAAWLMRLHAEHGSLIKVADLIGMEKSQCYRHAKGRDTSDRPKTEIGRELVERYAAAAGTTIEEIYGREAIAA